MLISIMLAVLALVLAMAGLFYDWSTDRFKITVWDRDKRQPKHPGRLPLLLIVLGLAVFTLSLAKGISDSINLARAEAESLRQRERLLTQIRRPELTIISEFPGETIRSLAAGNPDLENRLNQLFLLAKEARIAVDPCAGLPLTRGPGVVTLLGEILTSQGGLSPADFYLTLGFHQSGKNLERLAQAGFEILDMSMGVNVDDPEVVLAYVEDGDIFRLRLTDEGDGLTAGPLTITSFVDLPGAVAVLEPAKPDSAFGRGFVKSLFIHDRDNGKEFGIDFSTMQPATEESGWPPSSFVGTLGPEPNRCPADGPVLDTDARADTGSVPALARPLAQTADIKM